jgi:Predicted esterase of the alpha-beta hydrolase superfamily
MKKFLVALLVAVSLLSFAYSAADRPVVALVLSGGGSRGIPEISILKELERRGIYPDVVLGTSMGGLIGGLYSVGYSPDEITDILKEGELQSRVINLFAPSRKENRRAFAMSFDNIFSFDFDLKGLDAGASGSLLDDQYVNALLRTLLSKVMEDRDFDTLSIPFRSIGTDFQTGAKVVFSEGSLYEAMRGSMSLPVIYPPVVTRDGRIIIDGGTATNLPVEEAIALGADIIIAVDVNEDVAEYGADKESLNKLSGAIMQYAVLVTQHSVTELHSKVDYLFVPKTRNLSILDFTHVDDYIAVGDRCVEESRDLFDALEAELKPYLPMEAPLRYDSLEYPVMSKIIYPYPISKYAKQLDQFVGKTADKETLEDFEDLLDAIRKEECLRNVGYTVRDGVYTIDYVPFDQLSNNMSIGVMGDAGLQFNAFNGGYFDFYFNQCFSLNFAFNFDKFKLDNRLEYGQMLDLSTILTVPMKSADFFTSFSFVYGNFPPFGYRKNLDSDHFRNSNFMVELETGFTFSGSAFGRIDLSLDGAYALLGDDMNLGLPNTQLWPEPNLFFGVAALDYSYRNTHFRGTQKVFTEHNLSFKAGFSSMDNAIYAFKYSGFISIPIPECNAGYLFVGGDVATLRMPRALTSSFVPTVFYGLTRDRMALELGFEQFFSRTSKFFYTISGMFELTSEVYSGYGVSEGFSSYIPFYGFNSFSFALEAGVGMNLQDTAATLFARVGVKGDFALGIELR